MIRLRLLSSKPVHTKRFLSRHQHLHAIRPSTPEPEPDSDPNPVPDPDPVLDKFHYIDPGMLQYQRATFEKLFHNLTVPLNGDELKRLAEGRRLKLSIEGNTVLLLVYRETWSPNNPDLWTSMADLLNDWSAHTVARETLPILLSNMDQIQEEPIKIPLRVQRLP
jgi:hypothetical protein